MITKDKDSFDQELNQQEYVIASVDGLLLIAKGCTQEVYTKRALDILWEFYLRNEKFDNIKKAG